MAPSHKVQTRTYNTRFKPEEWEPHRSRICELFLAPRNTLEIVARVMREDEGFNATWVLYTQQHRKWVRYLLYWLSIRVKQYKDKLRVWGVRKYRSKKGRGVMSQTAEQKNAPIPGAPELPTRPLCEHEHDAGEVDKICSNTSEGPILAPIKRFSINRLTQVSCPRFNTQNPKS